MRWKVKNKIDKCPFCGSWPLLKTNGVGEYKYIISCQCEGSRFGGRSVEEAIENWMLATKIVKIYVKKERRNETEKTS